MMHDSSALRAITRGPGRILTPPMPFRPQFSLVSCHGTFMTLTLIDATSNSAVARGDGVCADCTFPATITTTNPDRIPLTRIVISALLQIGAVYITTIIVL